QRVFAGTFVDQAAQGVVDGDQFVQAGAAAVAATAAGVGMRPGEAQAGLPVVGESATSRASRSLVLRLSADSPSVEAGSWLVCAIAYSWRDDGSASASLRSLDTRRPG
ncbi:MAG: hypothetical protein Q8J93_00440, partial [Xanthomonadales bacterium]|nr:hypothetical protein [Xanthomonadales bacterium]